VARRRAAHQLLDRPLVLDDPVALRIIGEQERAALEERVRRRFPPSPEQAPVARALRAFLVARSRFAEETLTSAATVGVGQYVILGAGLDTFAYRNPLPAVRVFEVDHPATQAWKRECLAGAAIAIPTGPAGVTFVPVDFERQRLDDELVRAGFDPDRPAVFAWLGVTMYLAEASVWNVLRYVLARPPGSAVVFDYAVSPNRLNPVERLVVARFADRVARAGEPWTAFFDPGPLAGGLREIGASQVVDLDGTAINGRFFRGRQDRLRVGSVARIMLAAT
jgi:methyltransferase (TIGR00027 family)